MNLEKMEPIHRIKFKNTPVKTWRITWPDGNSETVEGHSMIMEAGTVRFIWHYIGAHRIVNLSYVRDITELSPLVSDVENDSTVTTWDSEDPER